MTGIPKPGDTLLFAVAMCAPYTMMNTHKYKAKILPGQQKRGRGRKLVQDIFSAISRGNDVETTLLKAIPETEIVEIMPKSCQVLAAGLNKIKQNKKQNRKKKEKETE